jgi:cell division transport system permease protein
VIEFALLVMQTPILQLSQLYQSHFSVEGLGAVGSIVLLALGLILGMSAALISVNKFLNLLEPK